MSNQSKEGCCNRINTLEKLPKFLVQTVQAQIQNTPRPVLLQLPTSGRIKNTVVSYWIKLYIYFSQQYIVHSLLTKQDKLRTPENITWLIRDLKCILRFLFSLEWICYYKSQKKNWKNFLNHQLITQIRINLIRATQVELMAAIFHLSCRLRLRLVQLQKLPRYQQLHYMIVKNIGTGDQQRDQSPRTHSHIGKGNATSHVPTFLHCWHYRWNPI